MPKGSSDWERPNETIAHDAAYTYFKYGNVVPPADVLRQLVIATEGSDNVYTRLARSGAYIDLACHAETTQPASAVHFMDNAATVLRGLAAEDWRAGRVPEHDLHLIFEAELYTAYIGKYKKALLGRLTNMEDEQQLYDDLIRLCAKILEPAKTYGTYGTGIRGVQFQIGVHLINARFNLKNGSIMQELRPSLPREKYGVKPENWHAAVSTRSFLDQSTCYYLQLVGERWRSPRDPAIITLVGREHLGTATTADVVSAALAEAYQLPGADQATEQLDNYERLYLEFLGWQF